MTETDELRAQLAQKQAVIDRIKKHVGVWLQDKRMRVSAEILLDEIARIEKEENEKRLKR